MKWTKYFSRKYNLQKNEIVLRAFEQPFFKKYYQLLRSPMIIIPEKGNYTYYYQAKPWQIFADILTKNTFKNLSNFKKLAKIFIQSGDNFVRVTKKISQQDVKKLSNQNLLKLYQAYYRAYLKFMPSGVWVPFILSDAIDKVVLASLQELIKNEKEIEEYLEAIFYPDSPNVVLREHIDMLQLALDVKVKKLTKLEAEKLLQRHCYKYQWIPCYDIDDEAWTLSYFARELKELNKSDPKVELKDIDTHQKKVKKIYSALLAKALAKRQREVFIMGKTQSFLRDRRDEQRREAHFYMKDLHIEIGRRFALTLGQVMYLTRDEIIQHLAQETKPDKKVVKRRQQGYVYLWRQGRHEIYTGQSAQAILKKEFPPVSKHSLTQINGLVAGQGQVHGLVKIVNNKNDLGKIKPGDIMVTVSTHPDYIAAMKKAAAIVTDEGGLTSHAAIVARELGIPCVVGTREATQIFKDGDSVEVDANTGVVKILK